MITLLFLDGGGKPFQPKEPAPFKHVTLAFRAALTPNRFFPAAKLLPRERRVELQAVVLYAGEADLCVVDFDFLPSIQAFRGGFVAEAVPKSIDLAVQFAELMFAPVRNWDETATRGARRLKRDDPDAFLSLASSRGDFSRVPPLQKKRVAVLRALNVEAAKADKRQGGTKFGLQRLESYARSIGVEASTASQLEVLKSALKDEEKASRGEGKSGKPSPGS